MENRKEALANQLDRIFNSPYIEHKATEGILKEIRGCQNLPATSMLWQIKDFSDQVDLSHPDLATLYGGAFAGHAPGSFSALACHFVKLRNSPNFCAEFSTACHKLLQSHYQYQPIALTFEPRNGQANVRFLPKENREKLRSSKKQQQLSMYDVSLKGLLYWERQAKDFGSYYRGADRYLNDIQQAETRRRHFLENGLVNMAYEIEKSIADIKNRSSKESYYGFHRISLQEAAIIAAKRNDYLVNEFVNGHPMVIFSKDAFNGYDFLGEKECLFSQIEYVPVAYTFSELKDIAPPEILKVIDHLEEFPEIGKKALFDHYRVVVPGVDYPRSHMFPPYCIKLPNGMNVTYWEYELAKRSLESQLLMGHYVSAVLLGERDGHHYFICEWI